MKLRLSNERLQSYDFDMTKSVLVSSWLCLILVGSGPLALATAPVPGWTAPQLIEGKSVKVIWERFDDEPVFIGWIGALVSNKVRADCERCKTIERKNLGALPSQLLVVPRDQAKKPIVFHVGEGTETLNFKPTHTEKDEIYLWGQTPINPCSGPLPQGEHRVSISFSRMDRAQTRTPNWSGIFFWVLKRTLGTKNISLLVADDESALTSLRIPGFVIPPAEIKSLCEARGYGCEWLFSPREDQWGKQARVEFKAKNMIFSNCPVY